jgi:hypothetical protein
MIDLDSCDCGSGLLPDMEYDARGIYLCRACPKCRRDKLSKYRADVLTNPNYETDEPIEPDC